jgi:phenylpropionate dioxygenase-like ring-hydroxylating dioxygenase large terminal subunit
MNWIQNCWQVGAIAREIDAGLLGRTIMDERIVFFRDFDGQPVALEDRCPHRIYPLSRGRYADGVIECGYHGLRFDSRGRCVGIPGQTSIPERARVRAYPVVERYGWIWVWIGDAKRADPALVPAGYHWVDEPGWRAVHGYTHFAANYQLLVDNLLDLSHETFVHPDLIGNRTIAENPVSAEIVDDRYVHAYRSMPNIIPAPFFRDVNAIPGRIDRYHATFYTPPSYIVVESRAVPAGSTDPKLATERRNLFPLSPESATSTHMFWCVVRNNRLDDRELDGFIFEKGALTQEQDRAVLEEQQRLIGDDPGVRFPVAIRVDAGPTLGRRLHERVLRAGRGETLRSEVTA